MIGRWLITSRLITPRVIPLVALACVASAPGGAAELWRDAEGKAECQLELVNELGGVRIVANAPGESAALVLGDPALMIMASARVNPPVLAVARRDAAHDQHANVEVLVPPGCAIEVRTATGAVQLDLGQHAFSVDISTVTGDITACIDPAANATVRFATSGEITTDFTIEIDRKYHEEPAKHGYITLEPGSVRTDTENLVQLNTRRGAVRMLRCLEDSRARQPAMPHGVPAKQ